MTIERGLADVPAPDLQTLLAAVERDAIGCPLTRTALEAHGFGPHGATIAVAFQGVDKHGVAAALRVALAERTIRKPPVLDLVWTGPESSLAQTRDTAVVVRNLFASAKESVLVAGYSFDHGAELLRPLHEGMRGRSVAATLFLDIPEHANDAAGAHAWATAKIDRFFTDNWPFGDPRPDVYYDPRTAVPGPPWASLHAKCVVVDERWTLIGSANFTQRGQERNIEAGVLIEDVAFAERMMAQWRRLIDTGLVRRYEG